MSSLRFHVSEARFLSFPSRFHRLTRLNTFAASAYDGVDHFFVSRSFTAPTVRFPFPAYRCETRNEAAFAAVIHRKSLTKFG